MISSFFSTPNNNSNIRYIIADVPHTKIKRRRLPCIRFFILRHKTYIVQADNDVLVMQDTDSNRMCRYFFAENIFKHSRKISAINELITTPNMFISGIFISIYDKIIFKIVDSVSLKKGRAIFPEA